MKCDKINKLKDSLKICSETRIGGCAQCNYNDKNTPNQKQQCYKLASDALKYIKDLEKQNAILQGIIEAQRNIINEFKEKVSNNK